MAHAGAHDAHGAHHPTGWKRWVFSTNHKDIGVMYLVFAVVAGLIGGFFSMLIRAELASPGDQIFGGDYQFYNVVNLESLKTYYITSTTIIKLNFNREVKRES